MNRNQKTVLLLSITVLTTIAAIYIGFFGLETSAMARLYRNYTFYFIGLTALLWLQKAAELALAQRSEIKSWFSDNYPALLLALAIVAAMALAIPGEYRILADETNLLGTAMAMYDEHQVYNPTQVLYYFHGMQRNISSAIDMRPGFYPFHVYVVHCLLGYDPANGLVVNLLAGFLILVLLYALIEPALGRASAALAMLLLAAFPLFAMYVRSCGFETVNLLWLMLLVFCCRSFCRHPEVSRAELVLLTLPLLAQTRYESALSVFCVVPLLIFKLSRENYSQLSWRTLLLPFLFLPVAWLRIVTFSSQSFQVASVDQAFGFSLLMKNLNKALLFFLGEDRQYGMVAILSLLALLGAFKLIFELVARLRKTPGQDADAKKISIFPALFYLISALTAVHALARFAYYWGDMTMQYTSRLGMVFLPLLAFLAVWFLHFLIARQYLRFHWLFIGALALLLHGWPVAANNLGVRDIFFYREFRSVREYLERNFPNQQDYFLITDLANLYIPFRYSAVYTGFAAANQEDIRAQLGRRTFSFALVIQKVDLSTHRVHDKSQLPENFPLKKLYETQLNASTFIRVSRLNSVLGKVLDVEEPRGFVGSGR